MRLRTKLGVVFSVAWIDAPRLAVALAEEVGKELGQIDILLRRARPKST